jgi:hypothetical protein
MNELEEPGLEIERGPKQSKQKDRAKETRDRENAATMAVMSTPEGRDFVHRLMAKSGLFELSYTGNADTNFREGRRSIGLHLHNELDEVCPSLYATMTAEHRPNKKENQNA